MSKYHSRKITRNGMTFDSIREYQRWLELSLLEKTGHIEKLQRQVKYVLIPSQYEQTFDEKTGKPKQKCVEREVSYYADFVYFKDGKWAVEDAKGFRTPEYMIKRKLMRYVHGIQIIET